MKRARLLVALLALAGCHERAHPWDQGDAEAPPPLPAPLGSGLSLLPAPSQAAEPAAEDPSGGAPQAAPSAAAADEASAAPATSPVRVGGPWVRCYGSFHPSGEPRADVTRLALLCGPENGMRRLSKELFEGTAAEGGAPVTSTFAARRGSCYRVFAVAEPSVADLDVTVESSRGAPIAADHGEDAWPIVQPDRPFCPLEDDRVTVAITAHKGRGRFAAEVWVLGSSPPHRGPKSPGSEAPD